MNTNRLAEKPHYLILDALRGVAAVMVVIFHLFEAHAGGNKLIQVVNHGYLAVDFFFLLSGFVIGYAYDDRWQKMSLKEFFKRRLIRLQPMVVMGSIVGAALFYFQQSSTVFPGIGEMPVWKVLLLMGIGSTMIPVPPSMDVRGWHETYPLNGPAWSLFYEYVANILYAVIVRRFSKTLLTLLVVASAGVLVHYAVTVNGDMIGGWSLESLQIRIGLTRVMFPFFAGLLLCRAAKLPHIKNAFLWCSLLLITVLVIPRIGGADHLWMNGLYESLIIIFIFPLIVLLGAGGTVQGKWQTKLGKFLGDISYPIYITHYPFIYWYTGWVVDKKYTILQAFPVPLLVLIGSITLAWLCLKLYDEPIRNWLQRRFLQKK